MPQSLHHKYGHLIFSTKNRAAVITDDLETKLYPYMGGIVRGLDSSMIEINGMADHVHLLIRESKSIADQDFIGQLKGESSRWINDNCSGSPRFAWQNGYGWFGVGSKDLHSAIAYVRNQKEHHRTISFEDEFRKFLTQYNVEFDERYVWD